MDTTPHDKFRELLAGFQMAMLVTRADDGQLRSRPMAIAQAEPDGTLWFLTQRGSGKVQEIDRDHQVNVSLQSATQFLSLSGMATPVYDRRKLSELWNDSWKIWFPRGQDDPTLILLRFDGAAGEYWDNSGASGIKYLFEAGKALMTGTRPDVEHDPQVHGKVRL